MCGAKKERTLKYRSGNQNYDSPDRLVKFIPIKHGDVIDMGDSGMVGVSGSHKIIGFKPAPGKALGGWLVMLIDPTRKATPQKRRALRTVA